MYDTGTTAFMIVCTMLVFLMTPALAFFYGGLSRRKNVVNTMFMSVAVIGTVGVIWVIAGWSLAYGGDGSLPFLGGFDQFFLSGFVDGVLNPSVEAGDGATMAAAAYAEYPSIVDIAFQAAFAIITIAIITGSLAGRMKFGAVITFVAIWCLLVYAPLAHMVWGGDGSLIGDMIGALDFAGGDVVHISSGLTGLLLCVILGKRRGYGMLSYRPHNVPFVVLGAGLLWFGWFGFNSGSAFVADGVAGLALVTTMIAPAAAMLSWMVTEKLLTGKTTLVGACTGIVAGLVVITPAAGFVEPWAALVMGLVVSPICYVAIAFMKHKLGYDDALDAFGCHCVGGTVGGILTGLFCVPGLSWTDHGGLIYTGDASLLGSQVLGILVTYAFVGIMTLIIGLVVKAVFKGSLRVKESVESEGLDAVIHGESAYPAYNGLD
ncbi:MAG: ammonium transporter [Coriobacteriales bacterium]|nr:ammonium transporter [Coriobacteriales bacterium]